MRKIIKTKAYFNLTKPGIIFGNSVTATGGFALASKSGFNLGLFFTTLFGLSLVIASACVFNNYIDLESDKKMERTKHRVLPKGIVSIKEALLFGTLLILLGTLVLGLKTNILALSAALIGFFVYVFAYSLLKYRTSHATLIGSVAGGVPALVGYFSASSRFDTSAMILFAMVMLWQMPHFFAIALYRLEDYSSAAIPVFPLVKGVDRTKIQMLVYISAFLVAAFALPFFGSLSSIYIYTIAFLGVSWLILCLSGFKTTNYIPWARKMFIFSLVMIMGLSLAILLLAPTT